MKTAPKMITEIGNKRAQNNQKELSTITPSLENEKKFELNNV
jgi:hypothetical protein